MCAKNSSYGLPESSPARFARCNSAPPLEACERKVGQCDLPSHSYVGMITEDLHPISLQV